MSAQFRASGCDLSILFILLRVAQRFRSDNRRRRNSAVDVTRRQKRFPGFPGNLYRTQAEARAADRRVVRCDRTRIQSGVQPPIDGSTFQHWIGFLHRRPAVPELPAVRVTSQLL